MLGSKRLMSNSVYSEVEQACLLYRPLIIDCPKIALYGLSGDMSSMSGPETFLSWATLKFGGGRLDNVDRRR